MKDSDLGILGMAAVGVWYMCYWLIEKDLFSFVKRFSIVPRVLIFILALLLAPLLAVALVANFFFRTRRQRLKNNDVQS